MTLKRSRDAQIFAAPVVPQSQTHHPTTTASTTETPVPTCVTRAGLKRLRGSNSEQPQTILDSKNSPQDLGDTHVEVMDAPAYIKAFLMDGEALPATDRVRPWRDGHGGKVAECVGKALLLPEDMKYWEKWDDDDLLLNMKRKAIMGYQCSAVIEERFLAVKAEAEEKTKAIFERNEALEKELEEMKKALAKKDDEMKKALAKKDAEMKKALAKKDAELKGYMVDGEAKIQEAYDQGQLDCISSMRSEVQRNLKAYFLKGWFAAFDQGRVKDDMSRSEFFSRTIEATKTHFP